MNNKIIKQNSIQKKTVKICHFLLIIIVLQSRFEFSKFFEKWSKPDNQTNRRQQTIEIVSIKDFGDYSPETVARNRYKKCDDNYDDFTRKKAETSESVNHHQNDDSHHHHHRKLDIKKVLERYDYALLNEPKLGYGRYSKVCEGIDKKNHQKVAIKIIDTRKVTQEYLSKFLPREVDTWKRLTHPNLVTLCTVFQDHDRVFLVMEIAEKGDLLSYVQMNGLQSERQVRIWMKQLISAVYYMHVRSVAHRDIKLENILIFKNYSVKIADFGFTCQVTKYELSTTFCGSKSYSAPEILLGYPYPPFKADIWSLGVVAFVLVTNRMPYNENVPSNTLIVDAQRNRNYRFSKRLGLSAACRDTINTMMTFDFRFRPDIHQTKQLSWFSDYHYSKGTCTTT